MIDAPARPTLVVVDDEAQVLAALEDQLGERYTIHAVGSGTAALALLEGLEDVSVLLSDQRMPGITGDELFARAAKISDAAQVMITGFADLEAVIRAVNRGRVFGYVTKPWEPEALRMTIHKAAEQHRLERELQRQRALLAERDAGLLHAQAMAGLAHVITARDGSFESWSETLPRLIGAAPDGMPRSTREWLQLVHPGDRERFRATAIEAGRRGKRMDLEYRLRGPADAWLHIRQAMEPIAGRTDAERRMRWFNTLLDITAQKQAAEAVVASEERHRAIFEQAAVGIVHSSAEGGLLLVNPKFCEMSGYSRAEALLLGIRELTHPEDIGRSTEVRAELLAGSRSSYERELRLVRKDGSLLWVSVTTSLVRSGGGAPPYFLSIVQDISERRQIEQELLESEARFRSLTALSSDWFWQTDAEHRFVNTPSRVTQITGLTANAYVGRRRWEVPGLQPLSGDWSEHWGVLERRETYRDLVLVQKRAGAPDVYLQISGEPVYDAGGRFQGYRGTAKDISERRRAEEDLRRFRLALDSSADMVLIIDRATMRHVDVNQTACRLLGYRREELLRMGPQDILPVSREALEKTYDDLIAIPGQPSGMTSYYRCKDGSRLPFESVGHVLRSGEGWLIAAISRDIRERIAAEQAVRESETRFRSIFENAVLGIFKTTPDGRVLDANPAMARMLGYEFPQEAIAQIGDTAHQVYVDPADRERLIERQRKEDVVLDFQAPLRRRDGSKIWVSQSVRALRDEASGETYFLGMAEDITQRRKQQRRIERLTRIHAVLSGINALIVRVRVREELFREACRIAIEHGRFHIAWVGLVDRDRKRIELAALEGGQPGLADMLQRRDWLGADERGGRTALAGVLAAKQPAFSNDVESDSRIRYAADYIGLGARSLAVLPLVVGDAAVGALCLHAAEADSFDDEEQKLLRELAADISFALEHIEKSERVAYLAYYDELTGLANRSLFHERVGQFIAAAAQKRGKLGLVVADVERFKLVNDSLGRQAGDELLRQLAARLREAVPEANGLARLSADHFGAVLPELKDGARAARAVEDIAARALSAPFQLGGSEIQVAMKAGIALYPDDAADPDTLFRNAEAALNNAKERGERYLFYAEEMTARTGENLRLESRLRRALERGEFRLFYQPKIDLESRGIVGVEGLIRWQDPERGLVPPGQFVPLLEDTGIILEVGAWALHRAIKDRAEWRSAGLAAPRVAVNVSQVQLRRADFVDVVKAALGHGSGEAGLDLEVTESLLMEDVEANVRKLAALRDLGVHVAIDDFGTGYSSLSYLAQLPVQALKVDRSFIVAMPKEANAMALVSTMINLAHSFQLKVVAEGVDSDEQLQLLRLLRCDEAQGFLFHKPMPEAELRSLLGSAQPAQA